MRLELTLDCVDLQATAAFWQAALGYTPDSVIEGRYVSLIGDGPGVTLQRVAEPTAAKIRMHFDLLVADILAEAARLQALGASRVTPGVHEEFGQTWLVLADPEGNEFCVAGSPAVTRSELIVLVLERSYHQVVACLPRKRQLHDQLCPLTDGLVYSRRSTVGVAPVRARLGRTSLLVLYQCTHAEVAAPRSATVRIRPCRER